MLAADWIDAGALLFQSAGESFKVFEDEYSPQSSENRHRILGVFVEVGIEDALIHEIGLAFDREEQPAEIVQLEYGENVGLSGHGLLDSASIFVEDFFPAGDDLRQDREPVAGGRLGKDRSIPALFARSLLKPPFGIAIAAGLVHLVSRRLTCR